MANPVFKTTGGPGSTSGGSSEKKGYAVELKAGEYVFREGDLGTEMYVINEGKVEILNQVGSNDRLVP